jgi:ABC-type antimicrobial peptide transport system permease subunit
MEGAVSEIVIGSLTFIAVFGGALIGISLSRVLPKPHLSPETRTVVSVSMAVVGTLAALVLGLMLTTANSAFSARALAIDTLAIDIVRLDRALRRFGLDSTEVRHELRLYTDAKIAELSGTGHEAGFAIENLAVLERISDLVSKLPTDNDDEYRNRADTSHLLDAISDVRWRLVDNATATFPPAFLVLVVFWLALLFSSFGLFAPSNLTVVMILLLCALAISAGVFMILELGNHTRGIVRVSVEPLLLAVTQLNAAR